MHPVEKPPSSSVPPNRDSTNNPPPFTAKRYINLVRFLLTENSTLDLKNQSLVASVSQLQDENKLLREQCNLLSQLIQSQQPAQTPHQ